MNTNKTRFYKIEHVTKEITWVNDKREKEINDDDYKTLINILSKTHA